MRSDLEDAEACIHGLASGTCASCRRPRQFVLSQELWGGADVARYFRVDPAVVPGPERVPVYRLAEVPDAWPERAPGWPGAGWPKPCVPHVEAAEKLLAAGQRYRHYLLRDGHLAEIIDPLTRRPSDPSLPAPFGIVYDLHTHRLVGLPAKLFTEVREHAERILGADEVAGVAWSAVVGRYLKTGTYLVSPGALDGAAGEGVEYEVWGSRGARPGTRGRGLYTSLGYEELYREQDGDNDAAQKRGYGPAPVGQPAFCDQDPAGEAVGKAHAPPLISKALGLLPPHLREALLLHGEGLNLVEVAECMGVNERTVRRWVEDAHQRFEKLGVHTAPRKKLGTYARPHKPAWQSWTGYEHYVRRPEPVKHEPGPVRSLRVDPAWLADQNGWVKVDELTHPAAA